MANDKQKKKTGFLEQRYIINACKNWFGIHISFNTANQLKAKYFNWRVDYVCTDREQKFEDFLKEYFDEHAED